MLELCPDFCKENVLVFKEQVHFDMAIGLLFDSLVNGKIPFEPLAAWNEMQTRTKQGIYMGNGLLLPHARVKGISNPLLAFGISANGFLPETLSSSEKATMICMVLSPVTSPLAHTKVIAKMASKVLDPHWVSKVLACENAEHLYAELI